VPVRTTGIVHWPDPSRTRSRLRAKRCAGGTQSPLVASLCRRITARESLGPCPFQLLSLLHGSQEVGRIVEPSPDASGAGGLLSHGHHSKTPSPRYVAALGFSGQSEASAPTRSCASEALELTDAERARDARFAMLAATSGPFFILPFCIANGLPSTFR
jgi:hypothetical protein